MKFGKTLVIAALPLALALSACETPSEGKNSLAYKAAMKAQKAAKRASVAASSAAVAANAAASSAAAAARAAEAAAAEAKAAAEDWGQNLMKSMPNWSRKEEIGPAREYLNGWVESRQYGKL